MSPFRKRPAVRDVRYPTPDGKREGIPVALMEAMACGLPVVATAISGIPELIQHPNSGLLVPPTDVPALADALQLLRRKLGSAARARVLELFDLRTNAQQLVRLIGIPGARAPKLFVQAPQPAARAQA